MFVRSRIRYFWNIMICNLAIRITTLMEYHSVQWRWDDDGKSRAEEGSVRRRSVQISDGWIRNVNIPMCSIPSSSSHPIIVSVNYVILRIIRRISRWNEDIAALDTVNQKQFRFSGESSCHRVEMRIFSTLTAWILYISQSSLMHSEWRSVPFHSVHMALLCLAKNEKIKKGYHSYLNNWVPL